MEKKYYRIEEVANRTGLTKRSIRYYESIELIKPLRTEAKYRLYSEEDIEKINRIKSYKGSLGFCLDEVKGIFELELVIRSILEGKSRDHELIEKSRKEIEAQINLIDHKAEAMQSVKKRYLEILEELRSIEENK